VEEYKYLGSSSADIRYDSLNILSEIQILRKWKEVRILIDSGATSIGFIDINYAKTRYLNLKELNQPQGLLGFNSKPLIYSELIHYAYVKLRMGKHLKYVSLFITPLKQYKIILRHGWLKQHDPLISWVKETLKFRITYCRSYCLKYYLPYEHI
jgi:hypothetical protein